MEYLCEVFIRDHITNSAFYTDEERPKLAWPPPLFSNSISSPLFFQRSYLGKCISTNIVNFHFSSCLSYPQTKNKQEKTLTMR